MPNELQPQGTCELQGLWIDAPGLPALVLPVDARRGVWADNTQVVSSLAYPNLLGIKRLGCCCCCIYSYFIRMMENLCHYTPEPPCPELHRVGALGLRLDMRCLPDGGRPP
jgi:hypothetical protein